jgi:hypothetical protein
VSLRLCFSDMAWCRKKAYLRAKALLFGGV